MNKVLITFCVLACLGAATAVSGLTSGVANAEEIGPAPKVDQPIAAVQAVVQDDCSIQVWPNFSQSCLRRRDTHVSVRNVSVKTIERH
jgi:hypothetical protein